MDNIIAPIEDNNRVIYAWRSIGNASTDGMVKIGETEKGAENRIKSYTHTAGLDVEILWVRPAITKDDKLFSDHDFHRWLVRYKHRNRVWKNREFFDYFGDYEQSLRDFEEFIAGELPQNTNGVTEYVPRPEQAQAVEQTRAYMNALRTNHQADMPAEYLWNAKPRFGKSAATYDLIIKQNMINVLIITNRPIIGGSWYDDSDKFVSWRPENYHFVGEQTGALLTTGAISYEDYEKLPRYKDGKPIEKRMIAFSSLQNLKDSRFFGGTRNKLSWIKHTEWDMVVIDESHEGIDTSKTRTVLSNLNRHFDLYLSGTAFTQLSRFKDNVFTWEYLDEQKAKLAEYKENERRLAEGLPLMPEPHKDMPQLVLNTYRMGDAIKNKLQSGIVVDGQSVDYAFDLNEMFSTDKHGRLVHEDDVKQWLHTITTHERYPFSEKYRSKLKHTFWLLHRVASAKALKELLEADPVFSKYKVVLAAGKYKAGTEDDEQEISSEALVRVKDAIAHNEYTITLSVGQLTTGVTVPPWTGLLMLSNLRSRAEFMQAAFRVQNPWHYAIDGKEYIKTRAYIFDFAPERTLDIYPSIANDLRSNGGSTSLPVSTDTVNQSAMDTSAQRNANTKELINWLPVHVEDTQGDMVLADVNSIMTIPLEAKRADVLAHGGASDALFNLNGIYGSKEALEIINRIERGIVNGQLADSDATVDTDSTPELDSDGRAQVPVSRVNEEASKYLGTKKYQEIGDAIATHIDGKFTKQAEKAIKQVAKKKIDDSLSKMASDYELSKTDGNRAKKLAEQAVLDAVREAGTNLNIQMAEIDDQREQAILDSQITSEPVDTALFEKRKDDAREESARTLASKLPSVVEKAVEVATNALLQRQADHEKQDAFATMRAKLRGFGSSIAIFLLAAYNDDSIKQSDICLENYGYIVDDATFEEMTGITVDDFEVLKPFVNEQVFNGFVSDFYTLLDQQQFYYTNRTKEDIFDRIMPQKTNQIFTPKWVVQKQLDLMEQENPDVFKSTTRTFVDFYVKSGQYLTEVAKRLFDQTRDKIPDDNERIKHILEHQVYGFAPTKIIYDVARTYMYAFTKSTGWRNTKLTVDTSNLVQYDLTEFAKSKDFAKIAGVLYTVFGKTQFDEIKGF